MTVIPIFLTELLAYLTDIICDTSFFDYFLRKSFMFESIWKNALRRMGKWSVSNVMYKCNKTQNLCIPRFLFFRKMIFSVFYCSRKCFSYKE